MKRKWFKKVIGAGLILTMLVGLTACGRTDGVSSGGANGKSESGNANSALAKEYVFKEQALELPDLKGDINVRTIKNINDKIYILMDLYNWEAATAAEQEQMKLVSMNLDGSEVQVKDFQKTMGGTTAEEGTQDTENQEGAGDAQETAGEADTEVTEDAEAEEAEKIDAETGIATDDVATVLPMLPEDYANYVYEYTNIGSAVFSSDGKIFATKNYYYENYSDSANPISENKFYVCCWDLNGVMQWELPIEDLQTEESYSYIQALVPMSDGTVAALISGDKVEKMTIDAEGSLSERTPLSNNSEILSNVSNTLLNEDGKLTVIYWEEQGDQYMTKIASYDLATDTVSEGVEVPDAFEMAGYWAVTSGGGYDVVYTDSNGVYAFNVGDTEITQIMSFINSDLNTTSMSNVQMLDAEHMVAFYYGGADYTMQGGLFTKVAPEDIPDKKVLVVAGNYVEQDIKNRIIDFNKTSDQYRIVVKEYNKYNTMDDYMAGYTQLNNDIITGNMPDILIGDLNISMENYISKGLIADIGSLIEQDEELSQMEYMDNVFNAHKVNDKLYYVIPSFYVRTMIAKESIVGDRTSWSMQDLKEVMTTMPEGAQALGDVTKDGFIYSIMQYCGTDFVDVSTGKCNFNSQDFIEMLEFVNTLPEGNEEFDEEYWNNYYMNYATQYREDRTLLKECYINDARNMNREINGYFGEDISYIGFPTLSGKGSVVVANQKFVLSAKSEDLDGAWQFIRYYLTEEYQSSISYGLPVSKKVFLEKAQEATQNPYWMDENGEKQEYEDTFYINDEEIVLPNMTQEQVDEFVAFVESIDKCSYYNQDVQEIIQEEAAAFFSGQKSAQDVAGIIQSRVQIFVNENR